MPDHAHYYGRGWQPTATPTLSATPSLQSAQPRVSPAEEPSLPYGQEAASHGGADPQDNPTKLESGTAEGCKGTSQQDAERGSEIILQDEPAMLREWERWPEAVCDSDLADRAARDKENAR